MSRDEAHRDKRSLLSAVLVSPAPAERNCLHKAIIILIFICFWTVPILFRMCLMEIPGVVLVAEVVLVSQCDECGEDHCPPT